MKKTINHRKRKVLLLVAVIFGLAYLVARPHINRLLDNRDRATMDKQILGMQLQIQNLATARGSYPSEDEVKKIVSTFNSPHTGKPYQLIPMVTNYDQVGDSQIAYGLGGDDNNCLSDSGGNQVAHIVYSINLPRVNEESVGCEVLRLDDKTVKRIIYELSCQTNWLGFRTRCDTSVLN